MFAIFPGVSPNEMASSLPHAHLDSASQCATVQVEDRTGSALQENTDEVAPGDDPSCSGSPPPDSVNNNNISYLNPAKRPRRRNGRQPLRARHRERDSRFLDTGNPNPQNDITLPVPRRPVRTTNMKSRGKRRDKRTRRFKSRSAGRRRSHVPARRSQREIRRQNNEKARQKLQREFQLQLARFPLDIYTVIDSPQEFCQRTLVVYDRDDNIYIFD